MAKVTVDNHPVKLELTVEEARYLRGEVEALSTLTADQARLRIVILNVLTGAWLHG